MGFGLMVERCIDPARIPVLVDLGYVKEKATRDRGDALMAAGVSRKNFSIEGLGRLMVKLPPKKTDVIFAKFPQIVAGESYFQSTHHWRGLKSGERAAVVR